ncbi:hypothetical protein [Marinobacterium sp. BA1]|uniref:hypothetical protein n=1 Tax=Marinobacterium sp. BA1 TaxID=3138931 RepID=UPI0034E8B4E6
MGVNTYIYRVPMGGIEHLSVRVPKDTPGQYWPLRSYSIPLYGEDAAMDMARRDRDHFISLNVGMPCNLAVSRTLEEVDADVIDRIAGLFSLQKEYGQMRLATLAMLGMFANEVSDVYEIADALDKPVLNLQKQIDALAEKGYLKPVRGGSLILSNYGKDLLTRFSEIVGAASVKLGEQDHYVALFQQIKEVAPQLALNMVGVLLAVDHGLTATSRIARAGQVPQSTVSRLLASAERYQLLEGNRQHGASARRFHHFTGLSEAGRNLLAQVSAFASPDEQQGIEANIVGDDPLAAHPCAHKGLAP